MERRGVDRTVPQRIAVRRLHLHAIPRLQIAARDRDGREVRDGRRRQFWSTDGPVRPLRVHGAARDRNGRVAAVDGHRRRVRHAARANADVFAHGPDGSALDQDFAARS